MKIVIDIDNESYEHIKAFKNEDVLPMGWYAIGHGTPLTKVDCISRQAVFDQLAQAYDLIDAEHRIKKLTSVTPKPKTGHWSHDGSHWKNRFICSECGYKLFDEPTNYCSNCGCRMVEPQERSETE